MSNSLAIATVTAALWQVLDQVAKSTLSNAEARPARPKEPGAGVPDPAISIYLYQALPNAALRNADLPTRRSSGGLAERPQVALDLYYLLSFYGNEGELEPQRLLGAAVTALHSQPLLSRERIRSAALNTTGAGSTHYLAASDLAEAAESVRLTPITLNLDELSKLWSVFFQTPYTLSVAYVASVVLLEAALIPAPALPVRAAVVQVAPMRIPQVDSVLPASGSGPILAGSAIRIQGQRLGGEITQVWIDGDTAAAFKLDPPAAAVQEAHIDLTLPAGLRAGVHALQVAHLLPMGNPPTPHRGFESNVAAFVLEPQVTAASAPNSSQLQVSFSPAAGRAQHVYALLNEAGAPAGRPARAYRLPAPANLGLANPNDLETSAISFSLSGVPAGEYLVRLVVDEAASRLAETGGVFSGPKVTVP